MEITQLSSSISSSCCSCSSISKEDKIIISIDIGSSSIRSSAYSFSSSSSSLSSCSLILNTSQQIKKKTIHNKQVNLQEILQNISNVINLCLNSLKEMNIQNEIIGIGISSFGMNFMGVDNEGNILTRLYTYADEFHNNNSNNSNNSNNNENNNENDRIKKHYYNTGTYLLHPSYAPNHFREMINLNKSEIHWQTLSSYIFGCWSGIGYNFPISPSEASWMGMLNIHTNNWDDDALNFAGINITSLPPITSYNSQLPKISQEWINKTGWIELSNAILFPGIVDGFSANIASKCYLPSLFSKQLLLDYNPKCNVAVTIGTSAAVRIILPYNEIFIERMTSSSNSGLWIYRVNDHEVIVGGSLTDGGSLVDWFGNFVGIDRLHSLTCEVEELYKTHNLYNINDNNNNNNNNNNPPNILPFWSGERSVGWNYKSRGTITGLSHHTTPLLMLLGLMEGVMMRIRTILERLIFACEEVFGQSIDYLIISGNTLEKYWIWRQLLSDITNRSVMLLNESNGERTLYGVAENISFNLFSKQIQALNNNNDNNEISSVNNPDPFYREIFDERYNQSNELYNKMMI